MFGLVEIATGQRMLFATLAASALLIYLDPRHGTNAIKTLVPAQLTAATLGLLIFVWLGPGYWSGGAPGGQDLNRLMERLNVFSSEIHKMDSEAGRKAVSQRRAGDSQ